MTENEAIESISEKYMDMEYYLAEHDCYPKEYDAEFQEAMETAMKALKEIQQYRAIGTVEECREARERQRAKKPGHFHKKIREAQMEKNGKRRNRRMCMGFRESQWRCLRNMRRNGLRALQS